MRSIVIGLFLLGLAWAQTLDVPSRVPVGQQALVTGQNLPPGVYALDVEGPGGVRTYTVDASSGRFQLEVPLRTAGEYRVTLYGFTPPITAAFQAVYPPPALSDSGLVMGASVLPLPQAGTWLGPVVEGDRVYVAKDLLVLEADLKSGRVLARHYPPNRVVRLDAGPVLFLKDGRRVGLKALKTLPYEGSWSELEGLAQLEALLGPYSGPRPYWSLLAEGGFSAERLETIGRDLLRRGHRPELPWSQDAPWARLARQAVDQRQEGLEASVALTRFLFDYTPLFPGSIAFFADQARWLAAQGQTRLAHRIMAGLPWIERYRPVVFTPSTGRLLAIFFALAYATLFLKSLAYYAQRGDGERRSRWPVANLNLIERVLALVFLVGFAASLVFLGIGHRVASAFDGPLGRASLHTYAAERYIEALPVGRERTALLAYARDQRSEGAPVGAAFAAALSGDLARALRLDPSYAPALEALGLGGDPWSGVFAREGVDRGFPPNAKALTQLLYRVEFARFWQRPLSAWRELGLFQNAWLAYVVLFALGLLALYHTVGLVLPRPPGARKKGALVRLFEALVPGAHAFDYGVGVLLFGAAFALLVATLGGWPYGLAGLGAVYLVHWLWWLLAWRGARS